MTIDTAPTRTTTRTDSSDTPSPRTPHRPARDCGPDARLVALPQLEGGLPTALADVDDHLARVERARQAQLDALPPAPDSVVAVAHRRIVARYVTQVRDARARVRAGTYGTCARCGTGISPKVLEREPWQTVCTVCGAGVR